MNKFNSMRAYRAGKKVFYIKAIKRYTAATSIENAKSKFIPYAVKEVTGKRRLSYFFLGNIDGIKS